MNLPAFVVGLLVLAGLEVVTSSDAAAGRAAMLPMSIAGAVRRLMDPTIALIPNWHDTSDGAPPIATAAATSKPPAPVPPDTVKNPIVHPGGNTGPGARM